MKHFRITVCLIIAMLAVFASNLQTSSAQQGGFDGRLNECAHLGFAVIYCVDANGSTTTTSFAGGGIKIVNSDSFITTDTLFASEALIKAVGIPAIPTLITSGGGYSLFRLPDGRFMLTGKDEYGKPFTFIWDGCQPQRCALPDPINPNFDFIGGIVESSCTPDIEADYACFCRANPQDERCSSS